MQGRGAPIGWSRVQVYPEASEVSRSLRSQIQSPRLQPPPWFGLTEPWILMEMYMICIIFRICMVKVQDLGLRPSFEGSASLLAGPARHGHLFRGPSPMQGVSDRTKARKTGRRVVGWENEHALGARPSFFRHFLPRKNFKNLSTFGM